MLAMRRRQRGTEGDFDALFEATWDRAVASARRIVSSKAVAEELAQEAFTRAWERWPAVSRHPAPTAWILRVTIHLAISHTRRRRPPTVEDQPAAHDDAVVAGVVVRDALAKLSEKQQQAIVLRYIAGCDEAEIAAAMKISQGTVKTHLSRGREHLALLIGSDRVVEALAAQPAP